MSPIASGEGDLSPEQSEVSSNSKDSLLLHTVFAACVGRYSGKFEEIGELIILICL